MSITSSRLAVIGIEYHDHFAVTRLIIWDWRSGQLLSVRQPFSFNEQSSTARVGA